MILPSDLLVDTQQIFVVHEPILIKEIETALIKRNQNLDLVKYLFAKSFRVSMFSTVYKEIVKNIDKLNPFHICKAGLQTVS